MTQLEVDERAKYESVWQHEQYRNTSPEQNSVKAFLQNVEPRLKEKGLTTLVSFGVGCGRAVPMYQKLGFSVTGIDIASNCLDARIQPDVFVVGNLWRTKTLVGALRRHHYGVCCDVMEHIPTTMVDAVLETTAELAETVFFQIALGPDSMGPKLIGEPLHLTVKPHAWWLSQLQKLFDVRSFGMGVFVAEKKMKGSHP